MGPSHSQREAVPEQGLGTGEPLVATMDSVLDTIAI